MANKIRLRKLCSSGNFMSLSDFIVSFVDDIQWIVDAAEQAVSYDAFCIFGLWNKALQTYAVKELYSKKNKDVTCVLVVS